MKVAVGSVVYWEGLVFLNDFIESLQCQTVNDFDIVLINDNIVDEHILDEYKKYFGTRLNIINKAGQGLKTYQLRVELLRAAKSLGYDLLILCDSDDKCKKDRVERICEQYNERDLFFYNNLLDFDGNEVMPEFPEVTMDIQSILEKNYLGLSNTALALNKLEDGFINSLEEGITNIFDWYLFSRIILYGGSGSLVKGTCTYYRVHKRNVMGISKQQTLQERMRNEIKIKLQHYSLLKKYDSCFETMIEKYNSGMERLVKNTGEKVYWWGTLM